MILGRNAFNIFLSVGQIAVLCHWFRFIKQLKKNEWAWSNVLASGHRERKRHVPDIEKLRHCTMPALRMNSCFSYYMFEGKNLPDLGSQWWMLYVQSILFIFGGPTLYDFFWFLSTPDLPQPGADVATLSQCLVDMAQQCGGWPSD